MEKVIICRYSEIHLKGNNRHFFEKLLLNNIKTALKDIECVVEFVNTRYIVSKFDETDTAEIINCLKKVFGIYSFSVCDEIDTSVENIESYFKNFQLNNTTFRVSVNRADKSFPINSTEFSKEIGGIILDNSENLEVQLKEFEHEVNIDIRENKKTYIYTNSIKGLNGMPVGGAGNGLLMLSGGIDSPVAGFKIANRGMRVDAIHFHSFPYTSVQAKQKVVSLAKIIKPYTHLKKMFVVKFTEIQEEIHKHCKSEYMITLMRRFMMRISERISNKFGYQAIITGESLGQVASQTVESLTSSNSVLKNVIVLRPLIAYDKEDAVELSRKIGAYETSILPYEDCCTVFLPEHPLIKPKLEKVIQEENKLDIETLVEKAVNSVEIIEI